MSSALPVLALALTAILLTAVAPRILASARWLRRTPAATLALWQVVGAAGVLSALMTAPAAAIALATDGGTIPTIFNETTRVSLALVVATVMSGGMLLMLLFSAHQIGRDLRADRRAQRHVVDVVASQVDGQVRVIDHPGRSAYCLPGLRPRVVLTTGAVDALNEEELEAVIAHEHAHTGARHDLMLEFFTVLHRTVPRPLRSTAALREVRLLIELLADRHAARRVGPQPLGSALALMAGSRHPSAALGSGSNTEDLIARVQALPDHGRTHPSTLPLVLLTAVVGLTPWALLVWAFWA
ncbi:M56 family metallopeptidase [Ornithinimicrobium faecis]|uniref:M56 family metallopeptidase n=1 Tax=Ornithinimicrobium faecis TaxID=2934158 RepID=A0ABY4YVN4_9MICO|nr:M56 family metallopeptidase [Ornithinimicrobium sp. HY1793]USQ80315.1 M56 family metallopeptidase [Ornithinimicrobium sp. HY1793]